MTVTPPSQRRIDSGFSFIELLAYIAIAALLILAAIPQFSNYRGHAYDQQVLADLATFQAASESYVIDAGVYANDRAGLNTMGLMVTRNAYQTSGANGMFYCGFATGTDYAFGVVSKSSRTFLLSATGGIEQAPRTMIIGGIHTVCPGIANHLGYPNADVVTPSSNRLWLHDRAPSVNAGNFAADGWAVTFK